MTGGVIHGDCINEDGDCPSPYAIHIVISMDVDEPWDGPVPWTPLPNHAEWEKARPAVQQYADDTLDVERVSLHLVEMATGEALHDMVMHDLSEIEAEMADTEDGTR